MNRGLTKIATFLVMAMLALSCSSYSAYKNAKNAERIKDWDVAVIEYEKALEIDPGNREYKLGLDRARREASRSHFSKGKTLQASAVNARGAEQYRLVQMAITELQLTVKLDPTNQWAAVELSKAVQLLTDLQRAANEQISIDEVKKRAQANISKAQPPQLNPASDQPITLTFSRDTNVKDIYRALGNAFGINVLFDQAVKEDRITIELRDVTAQQAIERVMQAANHFYKVLDEKTIIVVPDNPQARRDYEDLVIRTFYLSNGDAEQVTNVVRTMIEARNVFPLKALNAITIRDTADKVRIAEKIIEANDKAKAEVVVQVELVQLDVSRIREIGFAITGASDVGVNLTRPVTDSAGNQTTERFLGGSLSDIGDVIGTLDRVRNNLAVGLPGSATIPTATYSLLKTLGNSELLANPELRISEGEKATLHIGQRIPVPVTTVAGYNPGTGTQGGANLVTPYTSFQYQDVGIKVGMEPRVHHNREVTLKLTVEVSNQGDNVEFAGSEQPTFATRTIESTIRLKDGETNFLAGLIQTNEINSEVKTPGLGDIPFIGRLFTKTGKTHRRTDLVLTMTPHIIRIPDITEEDLAPMWVGTGNNLTFRGVSPRIESQGNNGDPFAPTPVYTNPRNLAPTTDGEPGNYINPDGAEVEMTPQGVPAPTQGTAPTDPFRRPTPQPQPQPPPQRPPGAPPVDQEPQASLDTTQAPEFKVAAASVAATEPDVAALRLAPRIGPQPASLTLGPGETKLWNVIGMDLEGLTADELVFRYDPRSMTASDVSLGHALDIDISAPPVVTVDASAGTIRVRNSNGKPLTFTGGGLVLTVRVHGGQTGDTFLVMENPDFRDAEGQSVVAAIAGGRARIQ